MSSHETKPLPRQSQFVALAAVGILATLGATSVVREVTKDSPRAQQLHEEEQKLVSGMMEGVPAPGNKGVLIVKPGVNTRSEAGVLKDDKGTGMHGNSAREIAGNERLVVVNPIRKDDPSGEGTWFGFIESGDAKMYQDSSADEIADRLTWVYYGKETEDKMTFYQQTMGTHGEFTATIQGARIVDANTGAHVAEAQYLPEDQANFIDDAVASQSVLK